MCSVLVNMSLGRKGQETKHSHASERNKYLYCIRYRAHLSQINKNESYYISTVLKLNNNANISFTVVFAICS